jgi:hypothetical protein
VDARVTWREDAQSLSSARIRATRWRFSPRMTIGDHSAACA